MPSIRQLKYPVLVISAKKNGWVLYHLVFGPARYFTFTRFPLPKEYNQGLIFDSVGQVCVYDGMTAWPELPDGSWSKNILENTIVPPILFRILALFLNFGPKLVSSEKLPLEAFKAQLMLALKVHDSREQIDELSNLLENGFEDISPAKNAADVIRWVDAWITDRSLKLVDPDDADDDHPGMRWK